MKNLLKKLEGKKTHLSAVLIALTAALLHLEVITPEVATTLFGLLGASGLSALRSGVSKATKGKK